MKAKTILIILAVVAALVLGFIFGHRTAGKPQIDPNGGKVDTLYVRDTTAFTEPQIDPKPDVLVKEIPVPVYVADSSAIDSLLNECARLEKVGDSLQLVLLRVQRHYSDSTYDAWVSGVDPRLDSIKTYHTNMVITEQIPVVQVKKTRWGVGIQAGYGATLDHNVVSLSPYVGVGVSYNILSW